MSQTTFATLAPRHPIKPYNLDLPKNDQTTGQFQTYVQSFMKISLEHA